MATPGYSRQHVARLVYGSKEWTLSRPLSFESHTCVGSGAASLPPPPGFRPTTGATTPAAPVSSSMGTDNDGPHL